MTATVDTAGSKTADAPTNTPKSSRGAVLLGVLAWIIGIIFVFPVLWMLLTSLHSETDAATNPPSFFAPLTFEGYANFFGAATGASPWPPLIN